MILTSDLSAMFLSIFHAYYLGRLERGFYKMFLYTSSYDRKIIVISVITIEFVVNRFSSQEYISAV